MTCKILSKNKSIHIVSSTLWYIKCRVCGDWFKYNPNSDIRFSKFCEYHKQKKHDYYMRLKEKRNNISIIAKNIFETQFDED